MNKAKENDNIFKEYESRKCGSGGDHCSKKFRQKNYSKKQIYNTAEIMAKERGVSCQTIYNAINAAKGLNMANKVVPGIKEKVFKNKVKIPENIQCNFRKMESEEIQKIILYYEHRDGSKISQAIITRERAKITNKTRIQVFQRDNYRCVICGASAKDGVRLEVDHIIPISEGGLSNLSNLQTLCSRCNSGKSDMILEQK